MTGLVQGFQFLVHSHHWILTGSLLGHPVVAPRHRDPVGIIPQDQSLQELQYVLDTVDVRVERPKAQL